MKTRDHFELLFDLFECMYLLSPAAWKVVPYIARYDIAAMNVLQIADPKQSQPFLFFSKNQ